MEDIKIYLRGHNLFDIFYGRYKENETELLERYLELAPREDFGDILASLEHFPYFETIADKCYIRLHLSSQYYAGCNPGKCTK